MGELKKQSLDGNVETIILAELVEGPSYGYALVRAINARHAGLLALGEGTVYPVLHRMEEKGLLVAEVRRMESGRDRKYYRMSTAGKKVLQENLCQWSTLAEVMNRIQETTSQPRLVTE